MKPSTDKRWIALNQAADLSHQPLMSFLIWITYSYLIINWKKEKLMMIENMIL